MLALLFVSALAASLADANELSLPYALVLGPYPVVPVGFAEQSGARDVEFVPEIDPATAWPRPGDTFVPAGGAPVTWEKVSFADEVGVGTLDRSHVTWIAGYASLDRYTTFSVEANGPGDLRLYVDGVASGHGDGHAAHSGPAIGGMHRVLLRIERDAGDSGDIAVRMSVDGEAPLHYDVDPRHPLTDYHELREWTTLSGLTLSPDGALLAWSRRDRDADGSTWSRMLVAEVDGGRVLAQPGGDGARPLAFSPDGGRLLFREGTSLYAWRREGGSIVRLARDVEGLGDVSWSNDGATLIVSTTEGTSPPSKGNARRTELRERLTDWPTRPHLHAISTASGARRRLMAPGDWVQDAFQLLDDGRARSSISATCRTASGRGSSPSAAPSTSRLATTA